MIAGNAPTPLNSLTQAFKRDAHFAVLPTREDGTSAVRHAAAVRTGLSFLGVQWCWKCARDQAQAHRTAAVAGHARRADVWHVKHCGNCRLTQHRDVASSTHAAAYKVAGHTKAHRRTSGIAIADIYRRGPQGPIRARRAAE